MGCEIGSEIWDASQGKCVPEHVYEEVGQEGRLTVEGRPPRLIAKASLRARPRSRIFPAVARVRARRTVSVSAGQISPAAPAA